MFSPSVKKIRGTSCHSCSQNVEYYYRMLLIQVQLSSTKTLGGFSFQHSSHLSLSTRQLLLFSFMITWCHPVVTHLYYMSEQRETFFSILHTVVFCISCVFDFSNLPLTYGRKGLNTFRQVQTTPDTV